MYWSYFVQDTFKYGDWAIMFYPGTGKHINNFDKQYFFFGRLKLVEEKKVAFFYYFTYPNPTPNKTLRIFAN